MKAMYEKIGFLEKLRNNDNYEVVNEIIDDLKTYDKIMHSVHFTLTDKEADAADRFYQKHVKGRYFGAIGGGMKYTFIPTGLGSTVKVETVDDNGKAISEDITDTSQW